jgi:hypothetical protein
VGEVLVGMALAQRRLCATAGRAGGRGWPAFGEALAQSSMGADEAPEGAAVVKGWLAISE